jgi:transcriptional regulator with XRE-family HTH domain
MRTAQAIGEFLKQIRNREGVNQTVIAQRCGVTQKIWSRLERGEQPLTTDLLQKLIDGIPINPVTLLGLEDAAAELHSGERAMLSVSRELSQRLSDLLDYIRDLEQQIQRLKEQLPLQDA